MGGRPRLLAVRPEPSRLMAPQPAQRPGQREGDCGCEREGGSHCPVPGFRGAPACGMLSPTAADPCAKGLPMSARCSPVLAVTRYARRVSQAAACGAVAETRLP
eukprot:12244307-Alexandrium_andersonii.AAC.1